MNITTTFERRPAALVCREPGRDGTTTLLEVYPHDSVPDACSLEDAEAAIRRAYAMGRADERRQTAAVLRGLMSC